MSTTRYLIRREKDEALLGKNGRWYVFSAFGDYGWCYKVYRRKGSAENKAAILSRPDNPVVVLELPANHRIDAHGRVEPCH